jgi:O-antigen/teichoic acid export membrane protein
MPSQTKKITLDTAALFTGRAIGLLLGLVRLNYIATYLGLSNFGILNFAVYFTSLFQPLFDLGLASLLTREIAGDLSRSRELVGKAVLLKLLVAGTSSVFVVAAMAVSNFDATTNLAIALTTVALIITSVSAAYLSAFQAHRKITTLSLITMINDASLSAAIILLLPRLPEISTVLLLTVLVSLANLAAVIALYAHLIGHPHFSIDFSLWRLLIRGGAPIAVYSLGVTAYTFVGPSILKYARGEAEVGLYSAGYKLISILTLIPVSFTQVIYPIFSDFFTNAKEKLEKALADSLRVLCILSVPLAAGTVLLAPRIFALLYTEQYFPGVIVLQILIVSTIFGYMNWILASFLLATQRQVFLMIVTATAGLSAAAASFFLVPNYGFIALPCITVAVDLFLFFSDMLYLRSQGYRSFTPWYLSKPFLASLVMACLLVAAPSWNLFVLIAAGALTYFVALSLFRGLGSQEKEILAKLLSLGLSRKS